MRGFKVVREKKGMLYSSTMMLDEVQVHYVPGVPVRPHRGYGPLLVFTSLQQARYFMESMAEPDIPMQIWVCEYEPYPGAVDYVSVRFHESAEFIRDFWATYPQFTEDDFLDFRRFMVVWPTTEAASVVTLQRRIDYV